MSYGTYSEVYFAIDMTSDVRIKIGETTNARRRNTQLSRDNYYIVKTLDVDGEEAERLFVESFLRARISATGQAHQFRKDYFECDCPQTALMLKAVFDKWVNEANAILRQMRSAESISFGPARPSGKPVIPAGREALFNDILGQCEKCGKWVECYQFTTEHQQEFLHQLNTVLAPFGYNCSTYRNYSWAYFKVEKVYC